MYNFIFSGLILPIDSHVHDKVLSHQHYERVCTAQSEGKQIWNLTSMDCNREVMRSSHSPATYFQRVYSRLTRAVVSTGRNIQTHKLH